jgi:hypothetical protein
MRHNLAIPAIARLALPRLAAVVVAAAGIGVVLDLSTAAAQDDKGAKVGKEHVEKIIADWPSVPKEVATKMMEKYGPPNEATPTHLVWYDHGPWKWSKLYKKEWPHNFPVKHTDVLDQAIYYKVPLDKVSPLAVFDGAVTVRIVRGELSAMCDKEDMNFLALNLAHEIMTGKKNVEEARAFQAETVKAYKKGEKHPNPPKPIFDGPTGGTVDPAHEETEK